MAWLHGPLTEWDYSFLGNILVHDIMTPKPIRRIRASKRRDVLRQQKLFHLTYAERASNILREGLDPRHSEPEGVPQFHGREPICFATQKALPRAAVMLLQMPADMLAIVCVQAKVLAYGDFELDYSEPEAP